MLVLQGHGCVFVKLSCWRHCLELIQRDLWGENPGCSLRWMDPAMAVFERCLLLRGVAVRQTFSLSLYCQGSIGPNGHCFSSSIDILVSAFLFLFHPARNISGIYDFAFWRRDDLCVCISVDCIHPNHANRVCALCVCSFFMLYFVSIKFNLYQK